VVDLVLLNGPPASGKSTVAGALVAARPLTLRLDVDVVRGLLGAWLDDAAEAGRAARRLALVMARAHLAAGHDVVVPQFLARPGFADELGRVAHDCDARFVEIALVLDREDGMARFASRQSHPDAAALAERLGPDSIATMYEDYERFLGDRHAAVRVSVLTGDVSATVRRVEQAIGWRCE
jgi:predicted kinase